MKQYVNVNSEVVISDSDYNFLSKKEKQDYVLLEKQVALRYNNGKRKWSLVDYKSMESLVDVLEFGAQKYAPWNWTKGMSVTEITESLQRHLYDFLNGIDEDPETGLSQIGHMQCNLMFLAYMLREKPEFDDRFFKNKK